MPANPVEIASRFGQLKSRRSNFDNLWDEIAEFLLPHRGSILRRDTNIIAPGEKQTTRLFDGTGLEANRNLAANMSGSLTSQAIPWFHLKTRKDEVNRIKRVQDWLEDTEQRMYLALRQSSFYAESSENYLDLSAFGTACLYMGDREPEYPDSFGGFLFRSHPVGSYVIAEGPDGVVDTIMREEQMTARACAIQWPGKLSPERAELADKKPDEYLTILHAVYPRRERRYGSQRAEDMPFASCYLDLEKKILIDEGGFRDFPYAVPRWEKTSGEIYGRGPGEIALPDVRTLNRSDEMTLDAGAMAIRPPMTGVTDDITGDIDLTPGGLTMLERQGALAPLDLRARFDVAQLMQEDRRTRVQRIFFWEQLQLPQGRAMTATEVERRWDTMRRILGPTLGRLESEYLSKIIARCFSILLRRGALLPVPPELDGEDIDIEYEGPLARSQKSSRLSALEQATQLLAPLMVDPEIAAKVKENLEIDELTRDVWQTAGAPSKWLTSTEQRDALRQQRLEQEQQQRMLAMVAQGAEAAGKGAPALKAVHDAAQPQAA